MKKVSFLLIVLGISLSTLSQTAIEYYNSGTEKYKLQNYAGAIYDFTKAVALNPSFAEAYYNRGTSKAKLQDYTGAIDDFSKAILIDPNDARNYSNRGQIKLLIGEIEGGCKDLSKAGELGDASAYDLRREFCQ